MSYVSYANIDSNNSIKSQSHFLTLFFLYRIFFSYIKMAKDSSAKYYQKKRIRRKLRKGIKIFLFHNTVVNDIKISQKMKNKG